MEKDNSKLFLDYIKAYGFDPNNYSNILELFQSANGSMSQYLTEYDQYLLSRKVNYDEIDALGINGANGYLEYGEICVPKTLKNDERFLHDGVLRPNKKIQYGTPTISEFDVIIGNNNFVMEDYDSHIDTFRSLIGNLNMNRYIGACLDSKDKDTQMLLLYYQILTEALNNANGKDLYSFEHDTIGSKEKEFCLIRSK